MPKPRADLRLLLLTDPRGYLEPCGCSQRPLGGLDKLAAVVTEAKKDGVPTLVLAAGDLTVGTELRPEDADGARKQEELRAQTFVEAWKQIGVSAAAPGPLDLALPPAQRDDLLARSGFPWLVDNVGAPYASARVLEVNGVKVGVLGLVGEDVGAIAQAKAQELRAQGAQLVVALVSGDRRTARVVAGKGPDVVLMGGLDLEKPLPPAVVGDALMVHAGYQGQAVVKVELALKAGEWEDASSWSAQQAQAELDRQIAELRARIMEWSADSKVAKADLDAQRARLQELVNQRAHPPSPRYAGRWFDATLVELAPEVRGDPAIAAKLDAHDRRVNDANRELLKDVLPKPAPKDAAHYVGSESCASCHQQAFAWWRDTKHGRAYATLERAHKEYNLSCVSCHVTGYNQPGGSTVTHVENLKNVGCENCHGPGSQHNEQPELAGLIAKSPTEATCLGCHTHEHSDRFAYEAFRKMLIVPGHGAPADRQW
ncbi:MAG TPA: multiheme c-type cytochrome [Polyangiales bacterium]|nr:multiheme c-type cytochrome [Polyangiales bacterium]